MVPHQEYRAPWDLLDAFGHNLDYVVKRSTKINTRQITYLFPRGIFSGLILTDLNYEKNNSQGQLSYEWGPVKRIGIFKSSKHLRVEELLW